MHHDSLRVCEKTALLAEIAGKPGPESGLDCLICAMFALCHVRLCVDAFVATPSTLSNAFETDENVSGGAVGQGASRLPAGVREDGAARRDCQT